MAYCTKADLDAAFHPSNILRWADDDGDGVLSTAELATVTGCIARADAIIDARLDGHYDVPFASTPAIIKEHAIRIAGYLLARRKGFYSAGGDYQAATIVGDHDDAVAWLDRVARGEASIPAVDRAAARISSSTQDAEPIFSQQRFDKTGGGALDADVDGTLDRY